MAATTLFVALSLTIRLAHARRLDTLPGFHTPQMGCEERRHGKFGEYPSVHLDSPHETPLNSVKGIRGTMF